MELKEIIKIFNKYRAIFIYTFLTFLVGAIFLFLMQPVKYQTSLMLNVTRLGSQKTDAYKYDDFYRLQADERFADTVVRWLGDPGINEDILKNSSVASVRLTSEIKAVRLSSQMIAVEYKTADEGSGKKIAASLEKVVNDQVNKLNEDQKDDTWFKIVVNEPVISLFEISFGKILFASIILGIFFGSWSVLIKHYFSK